MGSTIALRLSSIQSSVCPLRTRHLHLLPRYPAILDDDDLSFSKRDPLPAPPKLHNVIELVVLEPAEWKPYAARPSVRILQSTVTNALPVVVVQKSDDTFLDIRGKLDRTAS